MYFFQLFFLCKFRVIFYLVRPVQTGLITFHRVCFFVCFFLSFQYTNTPTPKHHILYYVHLCLAQCPRCVAQGPRCVAQCPRCIAHCPRCVYKQCIRNRLVPVSRPLLKVLQISQIPICSYIHRYTGHRQHLLANVTYIVYFSIYFLSFRLFPDVIYKCLCPKERQIDFRCLHFNSTETKMASRVSLYSMEEPFLRDLRRMKTKAY